MTTNDTRERVIEQIARKVRPHAFYEPEQYRRWANRPVSDYEWHTLIPNALRFSEEVLTLVEATAPDHQAEAPSEAVQALIDAADALTPDEVHDHPFAALDKVRGLTRELRAALAACPVVDDAAAKLRQAISWADDDSEAGGGIVLGGIAIREAAEGLLAALGGDQ